MSGTNFSSCPDCQASTGGRCWRHCQLGSATYTDPTQAGRYEWTGSTLVLTHCIHGLDLRLYPRCYLCRPEPTGSFSTGGNMKPHDAALRRMEEADRRKDEVVAAAVALRPYIDGAEPPLTAAEVQRAVERLLAALDALWRVEVQP